MMKDSTRISFNQAVSALMGGLAVFFVVYVTMISPANTREADLRKQLAFGAAGLLDEAKAQLAGKHYKEAGQALDALYQHYPVAAEATEGRSLVEILAAAQAKVEQNWASAQDGLRAEWGKR